MKAVQRDLAAKGGPKPAKRGRKGYSDSDIKERILAEAERRRVAGKRVTAPALLRWAKKNLGQNKLPTERTFLRWISPKRT